MTLPRGLHTVLAVAMSLLACTATRPAAGQGGAPLSASAYTAGTATNLFVAPDGNARVDGWMVQLPAGWALENAVVLRYGAERVPAEVRPLDDAPDGYSVLLARPQAGPHEVVLQVQVGTARGRAAWSITPFTLDPMGYRSVRDGERVTRTVRVQQAPSAASAASPSGNRALAFAEAGPLLLRADRLPRMQSDADFTIEFWLRTTGLHEVVLSTWTGRERDAYPVEVMIDASGRLRFYCGRQGRHESLTTRMPVADGRWHHIAVVHRAATNRLVLLREGRRVDALDNVALPPRSVPHVAVGGRAGGAEAHSSSRPAAFSGTLDELRFWASARTVASIRSTLRRALSGTSRGELVQLRFDEEPPADLIAAWPEALQRAPSALSFTAPLEELEATVDDGTVRLSWKANQPTTEFFVIERSSDGASFETVDRVRPEVARAGSRDGAARYAFTDAAVRGQVVYYRIRQQFADGTERLSGTLKIGLGAPAQRGASLIGNFPNPFSETTTIAYEVRTTQPLQLTVWDLSGQRITTLVDDTHTPGYYEQSFAADNLPSGTYFVRLQTPEATASHRMVLLK